MDIFEPVFKTISTEVSKIGQFNFDDIIKLFEILYSSIDFKVLLNKRSDHEVKMLFLLKNLQEISYRFPKGYYPIADEEKNALITRI